MTWHSFTLMAQLEGGGQVTLMEVPVQCVTRFGSSFRFDKSTDWPARVAWETRDSW